ncbi:MAG: histidine kinase [Bacteroidota bacterium]
MSRSFVYLSIFSLAALGLLIPPLSSPGQGLAFVVEELVSLALALIIFGLSLKFIRRRITQRVALREKGSNEKIYLKEVKEVLLGTALIWLIICVPATLYYQANGIPQFYKNLLEYKETVRRTNRPPFPPPGTRPPPPGRRPLPRPGREVPPVPPDYIPFWPFALRVFGVSFITIASIYTVEEVYANRQQLSQQKLAQQEWLKEQAVLQANVLKKQLNPHFMFNTLNVLSELIYEDIDKSHKFINELSKVYRYAIEHIEKPWSTLEEEINFFHSYAYLLKIRFDEKLQFDIKIDDAYLDYRIPAMTLELLAENAIKHNALSNESPLSVHILSKGGRLIVKNNLQTRDEEIDSTGIGLQNLNRRLELLGQPRAEQTVSEHFFEISVPLKNALNIDRL